MSAAMQRSASASGSSIGATGLRSRSKAASARSSGVSAAGRRWAGFIESFFPLSPLWEISSVARNQVIGAFGPPDPAGPLVKKIKQANGE
jgi:hypothetical protein